MPIDWVIVGIGAAIFSSGAGAATVVWKWEDILFQMKGKRIAVLGARQVGKTTLLSFISKKVLVKDYKATLKPEDIERKMLTEYGIDIRLKSTQDVAGSDTADLRVVWKNLCEKSDTIIYILRTDLLLNFHQATENRVKTDLQHITEWVKNNNKKLIIVGNHWNTDSQYGILNQSDKLGEYYDKVKKLPVMQDIETLAGGAGKVKLALGSLDNEERIQKLLQAIFI